MAQSPAHKFGQIIGDLLEAAIEPLLNEIARKHSLYLDKKGARPARKGKKVSWIDHFGNTHDLDYVLERGGTRDTVGVPVAFIETAWRRYTKHSRNKAQEIQGAILPLVQTHQNAAPFMGVVLAGIFTKGALEQLSSLGFSILYFPYETVVDAFSEVGIDARFDENTPDDEFSLKVQAWEELPEEERKRVAQKLLRINQEDVLTFLKKLEKAITRKISAVRVLPLHGMPVELKSIEDAINFVRKYDEIDRVMPVEKYEVQIRYNNGDRIEGEFRDRESVVRFLASHLPPQPSSS